MQKRMITYVTWKLYEIQNLMFINKGVWKHSPFLSGLSVPGSCCGAQSHTESLGLIWSAWDRIVSFRFWSVCILNSGVYYGRNPNLDMRVICVSHNFIHVAYYIFSTLKFWLWSVMWNQIRYGFFLSKIFIRFIYLCMFISLTQPPLGRGQKRGGHQISWNWSYRHFWDSWLVMLVLGSELCSSWLCSKTLFTAEPSL